MTMKDRLTVTIDSNLAASVRRTAHLRKTSVSGVVEDSLRTSLQGGQRTRRPFVERWAGRFSVAAASSENPRLDALKSKYGLK
jgi:hypothetical protein